MKAKEPPCGDAWVHEIKHDGFRIIARKDGSRVRLFTRIGRDFTHRFSLIVDAVARVRSRSRDEPLEVRKATLASVLAKAAADDQRSLTSLVEKLLSDYCREHGFLKPRGKS